MRKSRYATACWARDLRTGRIAYGMRSIGGVLELVDYMENIRRTPDA